MYQLKYRIPSKVYFEIKVTFHGNNIFRTIVDEGASNCVMPFECWKELGSPTLVQSHSMLEAFDVHSFSPHGIIVSCPIEWGGKTVTVDVKVVHAPIDYNFILGRSWIHMMIAIVS